MKPKTEELLNELLWAMDKIMRPTFRNLIESYESWAYREGLLRQLGTLEELDLVERDAQFPADRLYRLTEKGRLHALGGRDPDTQWNRAWDGRWRLVLFDVPVAQRTRRARLRRYLLSRGFGCLQGSVWVTPDSVETERGILAGGEINVRSMILLDARPCAGESDVDLVAGAWNFENINCLYARCLEVLETHPSGRLHTPAAAKSLRRWAAQEREAWLLAVTTDPLLPAVLLPAGYLGRQAWNRRKEILRRAGEQLHTFRS